MDITKVNKLIILVSILTFFYIFRYHMVINYTHSIPPGIYFRIFQKAISYTDFVRAQLYEYIQTPTLKIAALYKKVAGLPGDYICTDGTNLYRNNYIIDVSYSRYIIPECFTLKKNEYYLYTEHPLSLDSRIVGVFKRKQLEVIKPIFLFGKPID